jgi:hypothetical protein
LRMKTPPDRPPSAPLLDDTPPEHLQATLDQVVTQANTVILGKEQQIKLALACVLAGGHLLIEDLPGLGKTTLAQVLAKTLGLGFSRIQFTSDMLPTDILGVSVYDTQTSTFKFHPGPIFHQVILADEINRATPKAQSALLEAMEERQISVEGETRPLPQPFFVIATQNPHHLVGPFRYQNRNWIDFYSASRWGTQIDTQNVRCSLAVSAVSCSSNYSQCYTTSNSWRYSSTCRSVTCRRHCSTMYRPC